MGKRNLRTALLAGCLLVSGLHDVSAASWHAIAEVEQGAVYVDIANVRKNLNYITFWNEDRFTSGRAAGRKMTCLTEVAFLQEQKLVRDLQCSHFDESGQVYRTDPAGPWEEVTPESLMDVAIQVAAVFAQ
jgi:hypothetical protein